MAPIKVGIVGYGFAAKSFHIPFISSIPDYEITAILQRAEAPANPELSPAGSHCTVDFQAIKHYRSPKDFFADVDIAFVVIATRTDTHDLFVKMALRARKHVIIDKPLAHSVEEADKIIRLTEEKAFVLICYPNRRWDGGFQTLRKLIKNDALGNVKEAEIHYNFESPPWLSQMTAKEYTPNAGMAFGLGTHSIDQVLVLFGRPKLVTGFFRT